MKEALCILVYAHNVPRATIQKHHVVRLKTHKIHVI